MVMLGVTGTLYIVHPRPYARMQISTNPVVSQSLHLPTIELNIYALMQDLYRLGGHQSIHPLSTIQPNRYARTQYLSQGCHGVNQHSSHICSLLELSSSFLKPVHHEPEPLHRLVLCHCQFDEWRQSSGCVSKRKGLATATYSCQFRW